MDDRRFDNVARLVGSSATRRSAARLIASILFGAGHGLEANHALARKCRLVGQPCGKSKSGGKGKRKKRNTRCCAGATCNDGEVGGNVCTCLPNLANCHGHCVDINSDPNGCGQNCAVCPEETDCCNGVCCKEGQRCCGGECRDLTSDNANCGGCTQECPADLTCCDSRCRVITDDPRHCGACGHQCGARQICIFGLCVCEQNLRDCDGTCRDLEIDAQNCGACGHACGLHQQCQGGQCRCAAHFSASCEPLEPGRCGRGGDQICNSADECCGGNCVLYGGRRRCRPCQGVPCTEDRQCCDGLTCDQGPGPDGSRFCGGCRGRRQTCTANDQCCSSDCTADSPGSTCLSNRGGRCHTRYDCRECFLNGNCLGACVEGRCRV
jgi:hypothetical protein